MNLNEDIKYILSTINKNGFEAFVVGGCVRDYLMQKTPKDYDITTSAKPEDVKKIFEKTVDTGLQHGTVTIVLNKENYEVTTYRIDGEYENNRTPKEVYFTENLEKDLERRDFTMNAIAYNEQSNFLDPFKGQEDIKRKLIRGVGVARTRFQEDALRMFRAIRFSVQLGFEIEESTYDAILTENYLVENLSAERVREEFTKLLIGEYLNNFKLIVDTKLFYYYKKDFHKYLEQNLENIVTDLKVTKRDYIIRYTVLLKEMGYVEAEKLLKFLKFDNKTIKEVCATIKCLTEINVCNKDFYTRKLLSIYGYDVLNNAIYIEETCSKNKYCDMKKHILQAKENEYPLKIKDLKINGNDLKKLGITNGLEIGNTLNMLLQKVLQNPELNEKEKLINVIQS